MSLPNNNVGGMTGGSLPDWLADWLLMQQGGLTAADNEYSPNNAVLSAYTRAEQEDMGLHTPAIEGGSGDGFSPTFNQLNSNQLTTPNMQQLGSDIVGGVVDNLGSLTGISMLDYAPEALEYGKKGYNYLTDPSGPPSIGGIGSGLWEGAMDMFDSASKEVNSFIDNPVQKTVNALGFRTGDEAGVYSKVGLEASNFGTAAEYSVPLTGLFGTGVAGAAGLFEMRQLNEAMGRKGKTSDGLFDTWEGVPEEDQLGVWDGIKAWLSKPQTLNSMSTDRFSYANSPENFANFPGTTPSITPKQALYNAQASLAGGNWTGESISNPNAANNPYGPQFGGPRTAMTPEEVPAVFARANAIAAQQAAAAAVASSQAPYAVSNLESYPTDPSYYGTYTPDASGGGGGFSGGSGGDYDDNDTSYSEGWD